jgi:hypothetical protein
MIYGSRYQDLVERRESLEGEDDKVERKTRSSLIGGS